MNLTTPTNDTTEILLLNAINALRIAGQERFADDLDERLEAIAKQPTIAIFVQGGNVLDVRSNIGNDLIVEVVDADNDPKDAKDKWKEFENELEFNNY
jgi:hypothetical protein